MRMPLFNCKSPTTSSLSLSATSVPMQSALTPGTRDQIGTVPSIGCVQSPLGVPLLAALVQTVQPRTQSTPMPVISTIFSHYADISHLFGCVGVRNMTVDTASIPLPWLCLYCRTARFSLSLLDPIPVLGLAATVLILGTFLILTRGYTIDIAIFPTVLHEFQINLSRISHCLDWLDSGNVLTSDSIDSTFG